MKSEKCSVCKTLVPYLPGCSHRNGDPLYPFRVVVFTKRYVACSPRCAFQLGCNMAEQESKGRRN